MTGTRTTAQTHGDRLCMGVRRRAFSAGLLAAWPLLPSRAAPIDVLDRGATRSLRASSALMLALARAGRRLVAAGERGLVLTSDDDGRNWQQAQVPVSVTLTAVAFADATNGWATGHGGVILRTTDAGTTWVRQLEGRQAAQLTLDAAQVLPAGPGRQQAVRDAEMLVKDGPDKPLFDISFSNAQQGLAVGAYGMVLATSDGGRQWRSIAAQVPNPKARHLTRIARLGQQVWLSGEQGSLFMASGGGDFLDVKLPYSGTLFGLLPMSAERWLAYGLRGNAFATHDEGRNWTRLTLPDGATLTHAASTARGVLLVDQAGRILTGTNDLAFAAGSGAPLAPINAVIEAADQSLVLATVRGLVRSVAPQPFPKQS